MFGGVVNAGNQNYFISQNGPTVAAVIDGQPLATSQLTYTLNAQQKGVSTSGSASIVLTGSFANKTTISITGNVLILGSVASVCLPSGNALTCASGDTSEVPLYFTGGASFQISTTQPSSNTGNGYGNNGGGNGFGNGNSHSYTSSSINSPAPTTLNVGVVLESAYFNPFGQPIAIESTDGSIIIVTTYQQATVEWSNVVDAGLLGGALGTTGISGTFQQVAVENENLVAGTARDVGTMAFANVVNNATGASIAYMDASGGYLGTSTIPKSPAYACGTTIGIQTCTETGFQDQESFLMFGGQGQNSATITGSYITFWTVPAFAFQSIVSGHSTPVGGFSNALNGRSGFAGSSGGRVSF